MMSSFCDLWSFTSGNCLWKEPEVQGREISIGAVSKCTTWIILDHAT